MKHTFLKQPLISSSTTFSIAFVWIALCIYLFWYNLLNSSSIIFLGILALIEIILLLLHQVIVLDEEKGILLLQYQFASIGFYVKGEVRNDAIDLIYLNRSKYKQTFTSPLIYRTYDHSGLAYVAYIKLADNSTFHLASSPVKEKISKELSRLSSILKIEFQDNTNS